MMNHYFSVILHLVFQILIFTHTADDLIFVIYNSFLVQDFKVWESKGKH